MFIIYDLIILIFAFFYLPVYLVRRKFHPGFSMRLGILPAGLEFNRPIWVHAVSVGEAMSIRRLVEGLRTLYPQRRFVISTVTATGNKIARSLARQGDLVSYLPLDLSFVVRKVIDRINPSIFIIAETELWPNLVTCLYQKGIPVIVVNGRISDNSFRGYMAVKLLLKPLLNRIGLFCVQARRDAERLESMGAAKDKIRLTGNMKFDNNAPQVREQQDVSARYRSLLGLAGEEKLWVAGSTHPGEEEIVLDVYKKSLGEFAILRLLIAPRHPDRTKDIEDIAAGKGFIPQRISRLAAGQAPGSGRKVVFLLDTVGELISFYAAADIVLVGGSLVKKGGHNILEPASLGKPVLTGPHMFNFRDIAGLFFENKACLLVRNAGELSSGISWLLKDPSASQEMGKRARELILSNQGATGRNLEYITSALASKKEG